MTPEDLQAMLHSSCCCTFVARTTACSFHHDLVHKQQVSSTWSTSGIYSWRSVAARF